MAVGSCGRVFGWGLPALILGLLGAFSTTLIGLQTLNGLFCFDTVLSAVTVADTAVSSFAVSGYGHNHYLKSDWYCTETEKFLKEETYPFCGNWTRTDEWNLTSEGIICRQRIKGKGVVKSYSYTLFVNCTSRQYLYNSFMLSLTPGSSSMTGVAARQTGYFTRAVVNVNRCALSQHFYIVFSSACAAITMTIFVIRASMRMCLVGLSFRLSQSRTFSWVYEALEKQGFFNFENPYRNEPYHLVEGERFYVMRDPRLSCTSGDDVGNTSDGGEKPLWGKTTGSEDHCDTDGDDKDNGDTDSLVWSNAHFAYKFTYVDGQVFAYCKDRCGFETFVKANIKRSVALVIKQYLKQKSQSACITNDAKSHFLSLTECCELAQNGYKLVEKTSTSNYRIFYWSPRTLSHQSIETV